MNAPVRNFTPVRVGSGRHGAFTVSVARSLNDMMQVMAVRTLVYMGEQACPYDEEYDGNDFAGATHLILRCDDEPVGVVRLRWFSDFAKLERLAVRPEYRGGPALLVLARAAVAHAERKGYRRLMGHVQSRVIPFWQRYFKGAHARPDRQRFSFSDYDYLEMELELQPPADAISIDSDPLVLIRPEGEWDRPGVLDYSAAASAAAAARTQAYA